MDLRRLVQLFEVDSITIRYESGCPQAYRYETCENCMKDVGLTLFRGKLWYNIWKQSPQCLCTTVTAMFCLCH